MDMYESFVIETVAEVRSENGPILGETIQVPVKLNAQQLIGELCEWIEDAVAADNAEKLLGLTILPLPDHSAAIIRAVRRNDRKALKAYGDGNVMTLISSMMFLVVSLEEMRERHPGHLPGGNPESGLKSLLLGIFGKK